jgi:hypothetical protein
MIRKFIGAVIPLRFLGAKDDPAARAHSRHPCCTPATLTLIERDYDIDGLMLEVSRGGILFRESSRFTLNRCDSPVRVRTADFFWSGVIVNARPEGYGIRFDKLLTESELDVILDLYGVRYSETSAA